MPMVATDSSGKLLEPINVPTPVVPVAAAGSAIGNAAALSLGTNVVSGANGTKGVVLPSGRPGDLVEVLNNTSAQNLSVYPPVNGTVNGGSANAAVTVAGLKMGAFRCAVAGAWWYVVTG